MNIDEAIGQMSLEEFTALFPAVVTPGPFTLSIPVQQEWKAEPVKTPFTVEIQSGDVRETVAERYYTGTLESLELNAGLTQEQLAARQRLFSEPE